MNDKYFLLLKARFVHISTEYNVLEIAKLSKLFELMFRMYHIEDVVKPLQG